MNVSPDYSLPIRTVAPYFVTGIVFYIAAAVSLLGVDSWSALNDYRLVGWVHLFMVGFVMMTIIGAMGQMSVVVGEVYHAYPRVFEWIFPLLALGTVMLVYGLSTDPLWMLIGGGMLMGALGLFASDLFATLRRSRRRTAIIRSMQWSTLFLAFGLGLGSVMALGYTGWLESDTAALRGVHIYALIGGYVMINIMGVSTVLLPMFGACDRPGDNDYVAGFVTMSAAVAMKIGSLEWAWLSIPAWILAIGAVVYYMQKVYRIFTSKKRPFTDIWERSVAVAFAFLVISLISATVAVVLDSEKGYALAFWFFTAGFLGFLISAHLYKIVPFLVWFERFAPLIEEHSVPSMHELLPKRWADRQWLLAILGVTGVGVAIVSGQQTVQTVSLLAVAVSGLILLGIVMSILRFKGRMQ